MVCWRGNCLASCDKSLIFAAIAGVAYGTIATGARLSQESGTSVIAYMILRGLMSSISLLLVAQCGYQRKARRGTVSVVLRALAPVPNSSQNHISINNMPKEQQSSAGTVVLNPCYNKVQQEMPTNAEYQESSNMVKHSCANGFNSSVSFSDNAVEGFTILEDFDGKLACVSSVELTLDKSVNANSNIPLESESQEIIFPTPTPVVYEINPHHTVRKLRGIRDLFLLSFLLALSGFSTVAAVKFIDVSIVSLLLYTYPLFVVSICASPCVDAPRPSRLQILCHVGAFVGLVIALLTPMIADSNSIGFDEHSSIGYTFALIGSISFAIYCVLATKVSSTSLSPSMGGAVVNLMVTGFFVLALGVGTFFVPSVDLLHWNLPAVDNARGVFYLFMSLMVYTLSQWAQFAAFGSTDNTSRVTMVFNIDPVVSITLGATVLGESFMWYQWIGLFILVSLLTFSSVAIGRQRRVETEPV